MRELEVEDYESGMRSLAMIAGRGSRFPAPVSSAPPASAMNVCVMCGNMWTKGDSRPARCPGCRSTVWDRYDLHRHICKACSHRWMSPTEAPERCPSCHTRNWNVDMRRYECPSCGNKAAYAMDRKGPERCPECGSTGWGCERVACTCKKCGFVGNLLPGRDGKCPLCGSVMSPDSKTASGKKTEGVIVDSRAAEILRGESDEYKCITGLMAETGATEVEARAMFLISSGAGEIAAARELNLSFDYVKRVSVALSDLGVDTSRREADASV